MTRTHHRISGGVTLAVLAFIYLPIGVLFLNAFNAEKQLVKWGGFTTHWFTDAINNERIRTDFQHSLEIAVCATVLSLIIAITASLWAREAKPRSRALFDGTTLMRLVLPEVVIAVGLYLLFLKVGLPLGTGAVILGHVVFLSAYATVVLQARVATLGTNLEAAASDLGATPWRTFRRVTLPQLMPAVIVAGLLCFTFSLDDVITSQFLSGGSVETLPVLLLGLIRHQITPEVNAVGAMLIMITVTAFVVAVAASGLRTAGGLSQAGAGAPKEEPS
ncbi:MAG: ABC transporter permease [Actinobacteria bacterium]|nr:ABC transporter permease [Actinomycetota bacterium]